MADYRYADPESDLFAAALKGHDTVNGQDCYAIVITNSLNADTLIQYINAQTFLLEASDSKQGDKGEYTTFGDYRRIDGLTVAFSSKQKAHNTGQEQEITLAEYRSNPAIDAAMFEPPAEQGKDFRFVEGDRSENVPFRFVESHLFIPVTVECRERLWILDTGASITVISRKFADELGIEPQGEMQGAGAGGNVTVGFATLPAFSIKGIEFDAQQVAVIDMDQLNRLFGFETAGILGFDFLSRFVTRIDYANELVSFYDPDRYSYSGGGTPLDAHIKGSTFEVQASLDGRATGTWLFDVGATGLSMETPHAMRLGYGDRKGVIGLGAGAGATFESKWVVCDSINLAGFSLLKPRMDFIIGASGDQAAPDMFGLLGNRLFRNFVVYCDYKNERVVLEKGADFNRPWPEDHSGLQLIMNADWKHVDVHYVQAGTPAQKAGFKAGDQLKSINGIDLESFNGLGSVRKILAGDVGRKLDFVVTRDGKDARLKMTLADLYAK
jgi:predicted aspartyl protease